MLVFVTDEMLRKLCSADELFCDGTFKTCPKQFHQLYTIHCKILGEFFPVVFALLPDKTQRTYENLLSILKGNYQIDPASSNLFSGRAYLLGLELSPRVVQTDFEMAMMNGIRVELPSAQIRGCYFHYVKCIWTFISTSTILMTTTPTS